VIDGVGDKKLLVARYDKGCGKIYKELKYMLEDKK